MPRRSLRPQLNQIRTWVRQGRTDAWIAHQLEVTTQQIAAFKRENELVPDEAEPNGAVDFDDEIDLRAEDDALIAAELEAAQKAREKEEAEAAKKAAARARARRAVAADDDEADDEDGDKPSRRRGRRGGRRRKARTGPLEGTFDHGDEGYGLWLDPAVQDDPVYAEHWAGHRPVEITIEEDQIVIKRLESDED
jgi:DNA-binding protein H-NS